MIGATGEGEIKAVHRFGDGWVKLPREQRMAVAAQDVGPEAVAIGAQVQTVLGEEGGHGLAVAPEHRVGGGR